MFEVSLDLAAMLIGAAFVAGFVDSIAGGGGLITLPALLLAGASPVQALSTNKIQGAFGAASAALSTCSCTHLRLPFCCRSVATVVFGMVYGSLSCGTFR